MKVNNVWPLVKEIDELMIYFPTTSGTDSRYKNHELNYWRPRIWWVEDNDRIMLEKSSFKEEKSADDFFYVPN